MKQKKQPLKANNRSDIFQANQHPKTKKNNNKKYLKKQVLQNASKFKTRLENPLSSLSKNDLSLVKSKRNRSNKKKSKKTIASPINTNPKQEVVADLSDDESELIDADWKLADDSSVDQNDLNSVSAKSNSSSDLEESKEDVDEEVVQDEDTFSSISEISEAESTTQSNELHTPLHERRNKIKVPNSQPLFKDAVKSIEDSGIASEFSIAAEVTKNKTGQHFSISDKQALLTEVQSRTKSLESKCLYLSPIPPTCSFEQIKNLSPKVSCVRFLTKPKSKKLRGYAFLEYMDASIAAKEAVNLTGRLFSGKPVCVEFKRSQSVVEERTADDLDLTKLIVCGLVPTVSANELRTVFPSASTINLPCSPKGTNYGLATLNFFSDVVAVDAFSNCHGFIIKGHPISVNFPYKNKPRIRNRKETNEPSSSNLIRPSLTSDIKGIEESLDSKHAKVLVQSICESEDDENVVPNQTLLQDLKSFSPHNNQKRTVSKNTSTNASMNTTQTDLNSSSTSFIAKLIKTAKIKEAQTEINDCNNENTTDESEEDERTDSEDHPSSNAVKESDDDNVSLDKDVKDDDSNDNDFVESDQDDELMDSAEEEIDNCLNAALNARKLCTKSLKTPSSKRNWNINNAPKTHSSKKRKRNKMGVMPAILPVPVKKRR